jgi:adenosylmethionine-8-amino-7-oxononanoate aminotransferase
VTDWLELDRRHVWHPYTQAAVAPPPIPVERAQGVYLYTPDGRAILDGVSSWWVNLHGHNHPRLNRALAEQAERLAQVIFAGFTHEPGARLAAELSRRAPGRLPWVFYSDDGSTAVEVALKIAHQAWRQRGELRRTLFVAFEHAYHGDTFGAMAAGGVVAFHQAFEELFFRVLRARIPGTLGSEAPELDELLARHDGEIAAVVIEPLVQAAGGMRFHSAEALRHVRTETARRGIPLIADEIFTGFGRTGRFFACEHAGVEPDLLTVSKALTGGYLPLAATLATDELYRAFLAADRSRALLHGHSFTGNALSTAVALESLAVFDDERCLDRVARLEARFGEHLSRLAGHPAVTAVRGRGALAVLELATAGPGGYLDDLGPRLMAAALARGVLLRPLGNVLYFLPPYAITDDEVAWVFGVIGELLDQEAGR